MNWDPAKHPRKPKGTATGGQFAPGDVVLIDNGNYAHGVIRSIDGSHAKVNVTRFKFSQPDAGIHMNAPGGVMQFHLNRLSHMGQSPAGLSRPPKIKSK